VKIPVRVVGPAGHELGLGGPPQKKNKFRKPRVQAVRAALHGRARAAAFVAATPAAARCNVEDKRTDRWLGAPECLHGEASRKTEAGQVATGMGASESRDDRLCGVCSDGVAEYTTCVKRPPGMGPNGHEGSPLASVFRKSPNDCKSH